VKLRDRPERKVPGQSIKYPYSENNDLLNVDQDPEGAQDLVALLDCPGFSVLPRFWGSDETTHYRIHVSWIDGGWEVINIPFLVKTDTTSCAKINDIRFSLRPDLITGVLQIPLDAETMAGWEG